MVLIFTSLLFNITFHSSASISDREGLLSDLSVVPIVASSAAPSKTGNDSENGDEIVLSTLHRSGLGWEKILFSCIRHFLFDLHTFAYLCSSVLPS